MIRFLFIIFFLASYCLNSQVMWQFNKDTVITWYYHDGDEFNGTTLNPDMWRTGFPWGRTAMSQELYFTDGEDIDVKNGALHLYLNKRDYPVKLGPWDIDSAFVKKNNIVLKDNVYDFKYTAGLIWSQKKYRYGYFEMRFKCSKNADGMWPAFWTYGAYKNEEIDFFELKGERYNNIHVDVHCPDGCDNYKTSLGLKKNWGGWIKTDKPLDDGFNTIAGEWGEGYVKWYLNGEGISYFKGNFDTATHIIANMSVAKDKGPFSPGPTAETVYPGEMEVDYIRIWTRDPALASGENFNESKPNESRGNSTEMKGNNSSLKRKKRFLYGKKKNYQQDGFFISLIPEGQNMYQLSQKGITDEDVTIEIMNTANEKVFSKESFKEEFLTVNMAEWPKGKYTVFVKSGASRVEYPLYKK